MRARISGRRSPSHVIMAASKTSTSVSAGACSNIRALDDAVIVRQADWGDPCVYAAGVNARPGKPGSEVARPGQLA